MERTQIRQILQGIFEEETDKTVGELQDEMVLVQTFELDSVDYVSLIMRVEERFRIHLKNEELLNASTVGALVDLVHSKLCESSAEKRLHRAA